MRGVGARVTTDFPDPKTTALQLTNLSPQMSVKVTPTPARQRRLLPSALLFLGLDLDQERVLILVLWALWAILDSLEPSSL